MKRSDNDTRTDHNRHGTGGRRREPSLGGCSACSGGAFGEVPTRRQSGSDGGDDWHSQGRRRLSGS